MYLLILQLPTVDPQILFNPYLTQMFSLFLWWPQSPQHKFTILTRSPLKGELGIPDFDHCFLVTQFITTGWMLQPDTSNLSTMVMVEAAILQSLEGFSSFCIAWGKHHTPWNHIYWPHSRYGKQGFILNLCLYLPFAWITPPPMEQLTPTSFLFAPWSTMHSKI